MYHPLVEPWEGALDGGKPGASAAFRALGHVVQDGAENVRGQMCHCVRTEGVVRSVLFLKTWFRDLKGRSL